MFQDFIVVIYSVLIHLSPAIILNSNLSEFCYLFEGEFN
jgi:hypothetical protein